MLRLIRRCGSVAVASLLGRNNFQGPLDPWFSVRNRCSVLFQWRQCVVVTREVAFDHWQSELELHIFWALLNNVGFVHIPMLHSTV